MDQLGVLPWVAELLYQKYLHSTKFSREDLWLTLSWDKAFFTAFLKKSLHGSNNTPKKRCNHTLLPRTYPGMCDNKTIQHRIYGLLDFLNQCLVEISLEHLKHPNNHIPHMPQNCVGHLDTMPVKLLSGEARYQPAHFGPFCFF